MKPTNFSYFLEKYPFNVCASTDTYPLTMRPGDAELNLDKAMTVLGLAEEQMEEILRAMPFMPEDFGFIEFVSEGESEHDQNLVYQHKENNLLQLESHPDKAMTYYAIRNKSQWNPDIEEEGSPNGAYEIIPEFSVEIFLPNAIVGRIVLQSIGFLPLTNPSGVYESTAKAPEALSSEPVADTKEETVDTSIPTKIWPFMRFETKQQADEFNATLTGNNLFLSENPLTAMAQIKSLRHIYKDRTFTGVEEAIANHPTMTDEQRKRALDLYNQSAVNEQSTEAPKQVEPCPKCKGTGSHGIDLKCPWCLGSGKRNDNMIECPDCDGSGSEKDINGIIIKEKCGTCAGAGVVEKK